MVSISLKIIFQSIYYINTKKIKRSTHVCQEGLEIMRLVDKKEKNIHH
jgi:hypothetical protein